MAIKKKEIKNNKDFILEMRGTQGLGKSSSMLKQINTLKKRERILNLLIKIKKREILNQEAIIISLSMFLLVLHLIMLFGIIYN